jgi:hypothetical protein
MLESAQQNARDCPLVERVFKIKEIPFSTTKHNFKSQIL